MPNVLDTGRAIAFSTPSALITLTKVLGPWPVTRVGLNKLLYAVRRRDLRTEMAYHVEANPRGTGLHIHAWTHGDALDERLLSVAAKSIGWGHHVDVAPVVDARSCTYGMKDYLSEPHRFDLPTAAEGYLAQNGGRLVHATGRFWRTPEGVLLPSLRAAKARSREVAGLTGWDRLSA